eukprot:538814-Rhodomonas_salina.2
MSAPRVAFGSGGSSICSTFFFLLGNTKNGTEQSVLGKRLNECALAAQREDVAQKKSPTTEGSDDTESFDSTSSA